MVPGVLLRYPVSSSLTEQLPHLPPVATRSGRFTCHGQRSPPAPRTLTWGSSPTGIKKYGMPQWGIPYFGAGDRTRFAFSALQKIIVVTSVCTGHRNCPPDSSAAMGSRPSPYQIKKERLNASLFYLVPVTGLEPVRCRQRWILSPLRLPFHHTGTYAMHYISSFRKYQEEKSIVFSYRKWRSGWCTIWRRCRPFGAAPGGCPAR